MKIQVLGLVLGSVFILASASPCLAVQGTPNPSWIGKNCQIWDDDQHIPHIKASEEYVGIACLGYIHGRDRTWQMDFFKRTVQGRKAEVFGKNSIQSDFFLRLLGLQEKADALFHQMEPQDQDFFRAYAHGVNIGMKESLKKGIYEFKSLGYQPDPWRAEDTLGLVLLQAFDQTKRSFQKQLDEVIWSEDYGSAASSLFGSEGLPWDTSILKSGEYPKTKIRSQDSIQSQSSALNARSVSQVLADFPSLGREPETGSNNWVVGPKKSKTGNAWLSNDPHLHLGYPPFWEMVHLETEKIDAIGVSFPGVPLIVSGSNRHLSWGITNSYFTTARLSLVANQELSQAKSTRPLIWVKFGWFKLPFFFKAFLKTPENLPVLPLPSAPSDKSFVLRWTGLDLQAADIKGLFEIMQARTVAEADRAFSKEGVPSWNFVFADDQGGIGYRTVGRVPRFEKAPAFSVPTEKLSEVEKSSAFSHPLSPDEMPHVLNPSRGYVATANNRQWPADSLWSSGQAQVSGFRAFRIEELLKKTERHDLVSQQKLQCDVQAVDARFFLPQMLRFVEQSSAGTSRLESARHALHILRSWDFEASLDCLACGVFRRWMDHIFSLQNLSTNAFYRKLTTPTDSSFQKIVSDAFYQALDDLGYARSHQLPPWKEIHLNFFTHLSESPLFNVKPISTPGDENSVNPGSGSWTGQFFSQGAGASERLIVEMSQPPKVYSVLAGSNQDTEKPNLSEPHSEWQRWVNCELQRRIFPVDWSKVQATIKTL